MITIEYLRSFRFGSYAIFDLAVSYIGVYFLAPLLTKLFRKINLEIPRTSWLFLTLLIGILFHIAVGNYTQMTKDFLDLNGHYLIKLIVIGTAIAGLRKIKKIANIS